MFKVGDVVRINEHGQGTYAITLPGTLGKIVEVYNNSVRFEILELFNRPDWYSKFIGTSYYILTRHIELINNSYGPHLSPMLSKVRTMYARQQAKGILRY